MYSGKPHHSGSENARAGGSALLSDTPCADLPKVQFLNTTATAAHSVVAARRRARPPMSPTGFEDTSKLFETCLIAKTSAKARHPRAPTSHEDTSRCSKKSSPRLTNAASKTVARATAPSSPRRLCASRNVTSIGAHARTTAASSMRLKRFDDTSRHVKRRASTLCTVKIIGGPPSVQASSSSQAFGPAARLASLAALRASAADCKASAADCEAILFVKDGLFFR
mmetsp:Transcript_27515/g.94673  ORF Transcript_27515/g.94673 Transcript_27515/m.94673 type:complete len:225 (+) Transcript_27515:700-1374(+)